MADYVVVVLQGGYNRAILPLQQFYSVAKFIANFLAISLLNQQRFQTFFSVIAHELPDFVRFSLTCFLILVDPKYGSVIYLY